MIQMAVLRVLAIGGSTSSGLWGLASGSEFRCNTGARHAFLKWYQGWITPVPVTTPMGVSLPNSAENPVAYLLGFNGGDIHWDFYNSSGIGEYYLIGKTGSSLSPANCLFSMR